MSDVYLSVIIPIYNAANTIQQSVESVINECCINNIRYEIILVNDGSTDNSLELCKRLSNDNSNIKILTQNNSGVSVARNNGLRLACGDLIALNDADDKWLPGKLKKQLEELKANPDIDLLCAKYGEYRRTGIKQEITFIKEVFHNYFSPQTSIFRKKILVGGEIKFLENQKYSEDMFFLINVMQHYKCMYIPFLSAVPVIPKCVFGDSGLSSNLWEMEKGELSNILFTFKIKKIGLVIFFLACSFSFLKFIRRSLIKSYNKLRKKLK